MISLLQNPTCFCVDCKVTKAGFFVGLCFVHPDHEDPTTLYDTETNKAYRVKIGARDGVHADHEIVSCDETE